MEIFDKIRHLAFPDWVLIIMDCDGMIPYREAKRLITAVFKDDVIVYIKGCEKRTWLWNLLLNDERERMLFGISMIHHV